MLLAPSDPLLQAIDASFQRSKGVTTDTRSAGLDKIFFALCGERFDGNQYAIAALDSGCSAAIVDDPKIAQLSKQCILVDDVLIALQSLASLHRSRMTCPVIGLTGSNGKTTTKEFLRDILLKKHPKTFATKGNLNNHIGVPMTLLEIPLDAEMVILEIGANAQGEIAELTKISRPTHGVITNIGQAHLDGFGGIEGVIKGKRELFRYFEMNHSGSEPAIFVHAGHDILLEISEGIPRQQYGVADHPPSARMISNQGGSFFWVDPLGKEHGPIHPKITGPHNVENMLTALAIGSHFGVEPVDCTDALSAYIPTNNRSQWHPTVSNCILLDAYNANPSSMESSLDHFASTDALAGGSNICILGDMGELGTYAAEAHTRILRLAQSLELEIWTVGPLFQAAHPDEGKIKSFPDLASLQEAITSSKIKDRNIFLKGSRTMALESLIDFL
ncbi:MAG: UDP-N-acetylmuramoyl-tripeptide--D-alanyl-D-alanine ligase [Flavobacteriales bacterium]|nr:UDP-N-acetylmuramoyl-tripeptide--D-alanyl-D-alanine ligase [Flavobacteriales bacterium]